MAPAIQTLSSVRERTHWIEPTLDRSGASPIIARGEPHNRPDLVRPFFDMLCSFYSARLVIAIAPRRLYTVIIGRTYED
jgi:hypothetical protein